MSLLLPCSSLSHTCIVTTCSTTSPTCIINKRCLRHTLNISHQCLLCSILSHTCTRQQAQLVQKTKVLNKKVTLKINKIRKGGYYDEADEVAFVFIGKRNINNEMIKDRRYIFSTKPYNCTLDKMKTKRIPIATTASSNSLYKLLSTSLS